MVEDEDVILPPPPESEASLAWHERVLRNAFGARARCLLCGWAAVLGSARVKKDRPS